MRILSCVPAIVAGLLAAMPLHAEPGAAIHETCPSADEVGDNVECYPVTFTAKTEVHPDGIPIIGYLFVPKERPAEPLPAIVFAHGSGSMYSDGNHNKGLNSKHKQWVRQYTDELDIVGLHVSSFHSRYLLPDTEGDQRILDIDEVPAGLVGGDDYRATSYLGYEEDADGNPLPYEYIAFDPEPEDSSEKWKDSDNGSAGVSEVMERAYDMDAAWDFLAGIRKGRSIENTVNDDENAPTRGTPMTGVGYIGEIVAGLVVDHERIFLYGTSHGGQTTMATAHAPRALGDANPMNTDLPVNFERRRFAAFFDYYGGCGLYGAYNGADADSSWRPYGPFLMLHGENDDIWVDEKDDRLPTIREDWFENGDCENRIAAAKADPEFDQFLEAAIYEGAEHSFDGVKRNDFSSDGDQVFASWLSKIHANYRMTIPFMEAVGRRVAANRNSETAPSLADLGFSEYLPYFDTFPLSPYLGPQPTPGSALDIGTAISIQDLGGSQLDLKTLLADPFDYFDVSCEITDTVMNISESDECVVDFALTAEQLDADLPDWFWIRAYTAQGHTIIPARVARMEGLEGALRLGPVFYSLPPGRSLFSDQNGILNIAVDGFVWTRFGRSASRVLNAAMAMPVAGYTADEPRILVGPVPGMLETQGIIMNNFAASQAVGSNLLVIGQDAGPVAIQFLGLTPVALNDATFDTPSLPAADFVTNFVGLLPVDDVADDDDSGDDNSSDDNSSDDNSGDDNSGDDNSGDNSSDDNNSVGDLNGGSGGGGALLWLTPLVPLTRRR